MSIVINFEQEKDKIKQFLLKYEQGGLVKYKELLVIHFDRGIATR